MVVMPLLLPTYIVLIFGKILNEFEPNYIFKKVQKKIWEKDFMKIELRSLLDVSLSLGTNMAFGLYGGGACTIATTDPPGMSTLCTAQANGFCLVNTIDLAQQTTTGTGVCICYPGYSGTKCAGISFSLSPSLFPHLLSLPLFSLSLSLRVFSTF